MKAKRYLLLFMLCLLFTIGSLAKNSVAPMTAGYVFLKLNETDVTAAIKLTNWGDTQVNNITYNLYYMENGLNEGPLTMTFDTPLADGEVREVQIPIKPGEKLGKADVLFNITEVNGRCNEASVGYTYITCCTVNKMPFKRVLVEDYTAMWCWNCPKGMVATDALVRMFPDDVVAVSIHKADDISKVVSYSVYEGLMKMYATALPSVWIARDTKAAGCDATSVYQIEKSRVTYMNIDVKAQWDETGDNIRVTTEVEPCMTPEEGNTYAVGYVLTASGLTNSEWFQESSYSEYSSSDYDDAPEEMRFYADAANYLEGYSMVKGVVYNHVAIESKGMLNGLENSLTGDFDANETKIHTTTFDDISRYSVIDDRSKIEVVAVLFNTKTNKIENAARCYIGDGNDSPTEVKQINGQDNTGSTQIFDMQGRKVSGKPMPGLYIVNGRKVVIK